MHELCTGYVLNLLAEVDRELPQIEQELEAGWAQARSTDNQFQEIGATLRMLGDKIAQAGGMIRDFGLNLAGKTQQVGSTVRDRDVLQKKLDFVSAEFQRAKLARQDYKLLRRQRAKIRNRMTDLNERIETLHRESDDLRNQRDSLVEMRKVLQIQEEDFRAQVGVLHRSYPSALKRLRQAELAMGKAHCDFYVDKDVMAWRRSLEEVIDGVLRFHQDLRSGRYDLEANSQVIGGRVAISSDAIFACLCLGEKKKAIQLFREIVAPNLPFFEIFNVYRTWLLGHYLEGNADALQSMLASEQFSEGIREAYARTFHGLVQKNGALLRLGLRDICAHEWSFYRRAQVCRGRGVISLTGVAIARLAIENQVAVELPGPTVPPALVLGR